MQLIVQENTKNKGEEEGKLDAKSFRVLQQEDKFYRRLLSKENSSSFPSFRVYYTVASGTVPFNWETRPGTPKATDTSSKLLPPLTPPPSYLYSHHSPSINSVAPHRRSTTATTLCMNGSTSLFSRLKLRKSHSRGSPSRSSSSSISSTHASPQVPSLLMGQQTRFSSPTSSLSSVGGIDDDGSEIESPRSTLCFRGGSHRRRLVLLRKMMTSIVGRGSTADLPKAPKNIVD